MCHACGDLYSGIQSSIVSIDITNPIIELFQLWLEWLVNYPQETRGGLVHDGIYLQATPHVPDIEDGAENTSFLRIAHASIMAVIMHIKATTLERHILQDACRRTGNRWL